MAAAVQQSHLIRRAGERGAAACVYINGKEAFGHSCEATGLTPEQIWETPFAFKAHGLLSPEGSYTFSVGIYHGKLMADIWKPVHIISTDAELDAKAILKLLKS